MSLIRKKRVFISHSKDVDSDFVRAVHRGIQESIKFDSEDMNDEYWDQDRIDRYILDSRLMILVLDSTYKGGTKHEYEDVACGGKRVETFVFLREYDSTIKPDTDAYMRYIAQKQDVLPKIRNLGPYKRYKDADSLQHIVADTLRQWNEARMKLKRARRGCIGVFLCLLVAIAFCCYALEKRNYRNEIAYIDQLITLSMLDDAESRLGAIYDNFRGWVIEKHEIGRMKDKISDLRKKEECIEDNSNHSDGNDEDNADESSGVEEISLPPLPKVELNTFALVCDDELFGAGICDAVSQISPSITQSLDTTKAQWTISVKHSVQDIPKMLESDALQVEVSYIVNLKNNTENREIITKTIKKRGRSIIQNRDDAIRNANEEATKEIANILNQYKNENI